MMHLGEKFPQNRIKTTLVSRLHRRVWEYILLCLDHVLPYFKVRFFLPFERWASLGDLVIKGTYLPKEIFSNNTSKIGNY